MEPTHFGGVPAKHFGITPRPFALGEGEAPRRPDATRRLTFDDCCLWDRPFETALFQSQQVPAGRFGRSIVPIELAQPGDRQVVVHSLQADPGAAPLSIDLLAGLPDVTSVVADRRVVARRPLPHIRELLQVGFATPPVDASTLANLPGLVSLSLKSQRGLRLDHSQVRG